MKWISRHNQEPPQVIGGYILTIDYDDTESPPKVMQGEVGHYRGQGFTWQRTDIPIEGRFTHWAAIPALPQQEESV